MPMFIKYEKMKAFIYKFETKKNKYIYDINTNRVFQVSHTVHKLIDDYWEHSFNEIIKMYPQYTRRHLVKGWQEIEVAVKNDNLFSAHRPLKMAYGENVKLEDMIESSFNRQLILNVTERCNLRCSYCIYGGKYEGRRTHSERDMSFETARTALDKFLQNITGKVYISFFGGEPLLNFKLIKSIVEYAENFYKKNITWTMTTNGTLLTSSICDFLYKKNFIVTFSLDGPKEVHDRYRKLINGKGSFDILTANLRYLQSLDKDYYKNNILFSIVSAPPFNLDLINEFFSSEPLVRKNKRLFAYMNDGIDGFEYNSTIEDYETLNSTNTKLFKRFAKNTVNGGLKGSFIEDLYNNDFIRFYHRSKTWLGDTLYPNGCCLPGSRKVFVSIDHKLYICEKIDDCYEIGTVESWIDISRVKKLIDEYTQLSENCFDCWACRICANCFQTFIVNGKIDKNVRKIKCENTRSLLAKMLVNYYSILEENSSAFDYIKDIEQI